MFEILEHLPFHIRSIKELIGLNLTTTDKMHHIHLLIMPGGYQSFFMLSSIENEKSQ